MRIMRQTAILAVISALLLNGCSRHEAAYQAVSVSVIDDKTLTPIAGAKILTPCMGLSPFRTNTYVTDGSGKARVMYHTGFLAVNVFAAGYSNSAIAFSTNEIALVKLRRID